MTVKSGSEIHELCLIYCLTIFHYFHYISLDKILLYLRRKVIKQMS